MSDALRVVEPSEYVVDDVMVYVVDVPLRLSIVIELDDTAVTTPLAILMAPAGGRASWGCDAWVVVVVVAAPATPAAPAARPAPTMTEAATRLTVRFLFLYMVILSLLSSKGFSNTVHAAHPR